MQFLNYLETHVINTCNLNCKGCSHFSNIVDAEDSAVDLGAFERDFKRLRELFDHIFMIRLMGGEPFLNRDLGRYTEAVRRYFPKADLRILSNGLLIPAASDALLRELAGQGVEIDISAYPVTEKHRDRIERKLKCYGIGYRFSETVVDFHRRLNLEGSSDPAAMYESCPSKVCTFVSGGKLAVCPAPFMSVFVNKRFGTRIDVKSDLLDLNRPDITAGEIRAYLEKPMKACGYCALPEDFRWECGGTPKLEDWLVSESRERNKDVL